jgi:hypothetical protein
VIKPPLVNAFAEPTGLAPKHRVSISSPWLPWIFVAAVGRRHRTLDFGMPKKRQTPARPRGTPSNTPIRLDP